MFFDTHLFPSGFFLIADLFSALSFDHHDTFTLRLLYIIIYQRIFDRCGKYGLVLLRKFSADADTSVTESLLKRLLSVPPERPVFLSYPLEEMPQMRTFSFQVRIS